MKLYRLLKNLPTIKAGTIFQQRERYGYKVLVARGIGRVYEIDVELVEDFNEWFEEIETFCFPEPFEMTPELEMMFYTINYDLLSGFYVDYLPSDHFEGDYEKMLYHHMSMGLAFSDKFEARDFMRWMKARAVILQDTKGFKPDWNNKNQMKYYGYWCNFRKELRHNQNSSRQTDQIFFKSTKDLKESFEAHQEEWKTYLRVED